MTPLLRADVVTIFPDYLAPLRLSLIGKAVDTGLVELGVHDLRTWTHDRHRTVDDTPYGGGAGMVMQPEPWGEALDAVVPPGPGCQCPGWSCPPRPVAASRRPSPPSWRPSRTWSSPAGATRASTRASCSTPPLGCGSTRSASATTCSTAARSAVLVILEAVVRLLPGVVGNPESLTEESHAPEHDGLLEGPVYTKPTSWRGLDVPSVLLSGNHAAIAGWRRDAGPGTHPPRPSGPCARPWSRPGRRSAVVVSGATPADAGELLTLQRAAYMPEGRLNGSRSIPPLTETLDEVAASLRTTGTVLVARAGHRIVDGAAAPCATTAPGGSAGSWSLPTSSAAAWAARCCGGSWRPHPRGAPAGLLTGAASRRNVDLYRRHGFRVVENGVDEVGVPVVTLRREPGAS